MPLDPHARAPDDDDGNEWTPQDGDDDGIELTAHEAAFMPPGSGSAPRSRQTAPRECPTHFSAAELAVLKRVRTVVNAKGQRVLARDFLVEIMSNCPAVLSFGQDVAGRVARLAASKQDPKQLATELFQEAVARWLERWNYPVEYFQQDLWSIFPARSVGLRMFGTRGRGRIRSLLHEDALAARSRSEGEAHFFEDRYADRTPSRSIPSKDGEVADIRAKETFDRGDVVRFMCIPQVIARIQELVEITARRKGFGKYSASAGEVFRLLRGEHRYTPKEVAVRCGVPLDFVYRMDKTDEESTVVQNIRRFASDTEAYRSLIALCPDDVYARFRGYGIDEFDASLRRYALDKLSRRSPDVRGADASDD